MTLPPAPSAIRSSPALAWARAAGRELPWLAALALAALLVHLPTLLTGDYAYEADTVVQYWPLTRWLGARLAEGGLPLWLPGIFGGYPILADGELGELYPPNLLALLLLAPGTALVVMRVVHTALAAFNAAILARVLGLGRPAGAVAGLVFALGSFNMAQLHHENVVRSAAWLPLLLALAELACRAEGAARRRALVAAAAVLALSALGLHVQPVLLSFLALAAYVVFRQLATAGPGRLALALGFPGRLFTAVWMLALVIGLGLGLAGIQWVPLFELSRTSFRSAGVAYEFATAFALPPEQLVQVLFPYFFRGPDGQWWTLWSWWETLLYVGVPTLCLALAGALLARRREALFFLGLGVAGLLIAMADRAPFNLHLVLWHLPFYGSLRAPGRATELVVLALGMLAGYGVEAVARGAAPRPVRWLGWGVLGLGAILTLALLIAHLWVVTTPDGALAFATNVYLAQRHQDPSLGAERVATGLAWATDPTNPRTLLTLVLLLAAAALLLLRAHVTRHERWATLAVAVVAADLLAFATGLHPAAPLQTLDPPRALVEALGSNLNGGRLLSDFGARPVEPDRLTPFRLDDASGYASLETQRHFDYWTAATTRLDALLDVWGVSLLAVSPSGAGNSPTPLATALAAARSRDAGHFQSLGVVEGVELIRNARAFPRAFVVGRPLYRATRDEPTALERMQRPDFDPRRDVVLEEGPPPPAEPLQSAGFAVAALERPTPQRIVIRATLDAPGYLVVSESYQRGWQARVDSASAPLYLADFLFLAVPLDAGQHQVELTFAPLSLWLGAATSLLALLACTWLLVGRPAPPRRAYPHLPSRSKRRHRAPPHRAPAPPALPTCA